MTTNPPNNQNTERARIRYMRQNAPEYGKVAICGVVFLALLGISLCRFSMPAHAQVVTVTPLPGPIATATAAAYQIQQAQAQQAQAQQQIDQGQQAAAAAAASFIAAQKAASDARAALAAQQAQAVGEAIGRAEANITAGQQQISTMSQVIPQLRDMINSQAATIAQQGAELQQTRAELAQLKAVNAALRANNATLTQQVNDNAQSSGTLNYAWLLGVLLLIILLIGFVAWRIDKRRAVPPPHIESSVIDAEAVSVASEENQEV